ncbi:MAG: S41 family peptidase [Nitrospinae bacterium]|nr:S41 family peptidase [Nitrospinota bacterium]
MVKKRFLIPLIAISTVVGVLYVEYVKTAVAGQDNIYSNLKTFSQILKIVQEGYVEEKSSDELIEGAIQGLLTSLDAHSSFLNKESFKEMRVDTEGEFGGLGIEITMRKGILTVVAPIEDTPADKAGVMSGDKILAVDGEQTSDLTLTEAVKKMRGKPNTKVVLTVYRDGEDKTRDITIIRQVIHVKSTKSGIIDDGIGYIRLINFNKNTAPEMNDALEEFTKAPLRGLVLDLRNNPGGLLDQAVKVSEAFIPKGEMVVYTKGRVRKQNMEFKSNNPTPYLNFPIVVIVNQGSASASEIVAGALQDTKRAVILGTKTFGKGSVQTVIPLADGSAIRLTTSRYYTPAGQVIQENGITPDLKVERVFTEMDDEEKKKMVIREKDLKNTLTAKDSKGKVYKKEDTKKEEKNYDKIFEKLRLKKNDNQLQSALQLLKSWEVFKKITQNKYSKK